MIFQTLMNGSRLVSPQVTDWSDVQVQLQSDRQNLNSWCHINMIKVN